MATGRSGQVDSPGGALTAPPNTDNYNPAGFSPIGSTPADTSQAAGYEPAQTAPWRKPGSPVSMPFNGYTDVAHVGIGTVSNDRATTHKG